MFKINTDILRIDGKKTGRKLPWFPAIFEHPGLRGTDLRRPLAASVVVRGDGCEQKAVAIWNIDIETPK